MRRVPEPDRHCRVGCSCDSREFITPDGRGAKAIAYRPRYTKLIDNERHFFKALLDTFGSLINQKCCRRSPQMSYSKVIMSVRLSVGALDFKGWFVMLPLR